MIYVLLDDEGNVVRYFDHPAEGTVEVTEPKHSYDELHEILGDCML
jgi:hypothetical protein